KVALPDSDPVRSAVQFLSKHPHDLIVLATHQHDGLERWIHHKVAEPIARKSAEMTLFIPHQGAGFVTAANGEPRLRSILIPVDRVPDPQTAIDAAAAISDAMDGSETAGTLLHIGPEAEIPELLLPSSGG